MISDADLKRLQGSTSRRLAEVRKVEHMIDHCITWLKLYAREGKTEDYDSMNEDLEQALVELWQLAAIK